MTFLFKIWLTKTLCDEGKREICVFTETRQHALEATYWETHDGDKTNQSKTKQDLTTPKKLQKKYLCL